jgi:hypothetical protein
MTPRATRREVWVPLVAVIAGGVAAQQRLHRRYRHLVGHGKRPPVAVAAIARELVGFLWAP